MILNLKLVKINSDYCDYLRNYDNRVSYNKYSKELRPFVGILFKIGKVEYFAPLSSPKTKHLNMKNTIDFLKIDLGKLGAVNFNNMIPVFCENYNIINLEEKVNKKSDILYQNLLKNQLSWLNANYKQLQNKAYKLYNLHKSGKLSKRIYDRCCDFKLLEKVCKEYNKK